jgi:hypothetical protein
MQKMAVESLADLVKQAERIGVDDPRKEIHQPSQGEHFSAGRQHPVES